MIESTTQDGVAVLAMRHGKANALDIELCQALCGALDDAVAGGAAAVVLTGAGTVFSAGVDLKQVTAGREGYVAAFLPELRRVFTRLAALELPVVAAVNGHAIAGGFILSAAADWAVMAEGPGRAGVTELLVGVPFPGVALELLRLRAGDAQARPLALSGATFGAREALARGLVDEAVPAAELADRSLAAARRHQRAEHVQHRRAMHQVRRTVAAGQGARPVRPGIADNPVSEPGRERPEDDLPHRVRQGT